MGCKNQYWKEEAFMRGIGGNSPQVSALDAESSNWKYKVGSVHLREPKKHPLNDSFQIHHSFLLIQQLI